MSQKPVRISRRTALGAGVALTLGGKVFAQAAK